MTWDFDTPAIPYGGNPWGDGCLRPSHHATDEVPRLEPMAAGKRSRCIQAHGIDGERAWINYWGRTPCNKWWFGKRFFLGGQFGLFSGDISEFWGGHLRHVLCNWLYVYCFFCFETACSEDATKLQGRGWFRFPPLKPFSLSGGNVIHKCTITTSPMHSEVSPIP